MSFRRHRHKHNQTMEQRLSERCPFYIGMRIFDLRDGTYVGPVMDIEYGTLTKTFSGNCLTRQSGNELEITGVWDEELVFNQDQSSNDFARRAAGDLECMTHGRRNAIWQDVYGEDPAHDPYKELRQPASPLNELTESERIEAERQLSEAYNDMGNFNRQCID